MSRTTTSFGQVLRRLRSAAALSQEELAERAGLSRNGISNLERGLNPAPRLETVRLLADALALGEVDRKALLNAARPALLWSESAPAAPASFAPLPRPLTRLIGRETEVAALRTALEDGAVRFLTVTGPGGVGKTRLAIAVALEMPQGFPDGVVFVDLTPLVDPALVVPTMATALGVRESAGRPLIESLAAFLSAKRLLLVLDNCERVLAAAADIVRLLTDSPALTVLATSREAFHVHGEREFAVLPLSLPNPDRPLALAELAQVPAVALFVERATARHHGFRLIDENAAAIAGVCQRLDGLPLAIELAAARVNVLSPAALLARLQRRLPVLIGGGRDLPTRQRTMRDAIAWSYDLLSPEEQTLLRQLAVFAGGFTLSAAEAVVDALGDFAVLDGISGLVERSLLRQVSAEDDQPRYGMLETIREYGAEKLAASGEAGTVGARHAAYYRELIEHAAPHLWSHDQLVWLDRIEAEHDNVRAALTWSQDQAMGLETVARSALTLAWFWYLHGHMTEGRNWLDGLLVDAAGEACVLSASARARTLVGAGFLAYGKGDLAQAAARLEEGVALARAVGEHATLVRALMFLGFALRDQGHYERSAALFEESLRLAKVIDDPWGIGCSLYLLSTVAYFLGDEEQEAGFAAASLPILRQQGDRLGLAFALLACGRVSSSQGDFNRANILIEESLVLCRALRNDRGIGYGLRELGTTARRQGDLVRAATYAAASLTPWQQLGNMVGLAEGLEELAAIATAQGLAEGGVRLAGAAAALREASGAPLAPRFHAALEQDLAPARTGLGQAAFAPAWNAGRALSVDDALAEGRGLADAAQVTSVVKPEWGMANADPYLIP